MGQGGFMNVVSCVDFCRALGDETRQELLKLLQKEGEQCVGCLVERFGLTQPTISHHLLLLKRAGLVKSRKAGKQVYYAIDQANVVECCGMLLATFTPEPSRTIALPIAVGAAPATREVTFAGERNTK
jgi:DNA-binding transcriptional ArsR family regulator